MSKADLTHPEIDSKLIKCNSCDIEKECIYYKCEVDYRSELNCENQIPLCNNCYTKCNVYVCKDHYSDIFITYMCEYTNQSYSHSPVYYWFPHLGIQRVYDTVCQFCNNTFYTCNKHEHSPYKKITCARCCQEKLNIELPEYLIGLQNKIKEKRKKLKNRKKLTMDETYIYK